MLMHVAAILGRELVHAAVGVAASHRKAFRRVARRIGLVGQMATMTAGPEFGQAWRPSLEAAGPLVPAAIPAGAEDGTSVSSSASVALASVRLILCADRSTWPGHRS